MNLRAGIPFIHFYHRYTRGSVVVHFPLNSYEVEHTPFTQDSFISMKQPVAFTSGKSRNL